MNSARNNFGIAAFFVTALVITFALSPYVPEAKNQVLLVILGYALSWPDRVLQFHYGSSAGSKEKTALLAQAEPLLLNQEAPEQ
jgi:hypothetical protein